jgi:hypothetical protein
MRSLERALLYILGLCYNWPIRECGSYIFGKQMTRTQREKTGNLTTAAARVRRTAINVV